jgi:hypothetical protein
MEGAPVRPKPARSLHRGFEPSRLTSQFLATAYEQLVPVLRRRIASERRRHRVGTPAQSTAPYCQAACGG